MVHISEIGESSTVSAVPPVPLHTPSKPQLSPPPPPPPSPTSLPPPPDATNAQQAQAPQSIEQMARQLAGKAHIYVAVPCYNCQMRREFATSLMQLQAVCLRYGVQISVQMMGNESLISRGRCILTGNFLTSSANFLLFIDADIAFNPATVLRLALHNKEISSAVYPKKMINWDLVREKRLAGSTNVEDIRAAGLDYNINIFGTQATIDNGFIRVLDAATGFFMMRRDAVERLANHYKDELHCVNDIQGSIQAVPTFCALFDTTICPKTRRYLSEDYALCRRAQALDPPIEIWADVASPLTHIGSLALDGDIAQRFEMRYVG